MDYKVIPGDGTRGDMFFVTVSSFVTMARRLHMFVAGPAAQLAMGVASFGVTFTFSATNVFTFVTDIIVHAADPSCFDTYHLRGMERLVTAAPIPDESFAPAVGLPRQEVNTLQDMTEVSGDVYARPVTAECGRVDELAPIRDIDWTKAIDSGLGNARLCVDVSPDRKYHALARIVAICAGEGSVVIAGDSPGSLGQNLVAGGRDVIGIDPLNRDVKRKGIGCRGEYHQIRGEITHIGDRLGYQTENDTRMPLPAKVGCLVMDTVVDGESAETSTARNLAYGWKHKHDNPDTIVIVQLRSAPLVAGLYGILQLPGHRNQGCETYAVLCFDHHDNFGRRGWQGFCWALLRAHAQIGCPGREEATELDPADMFTFRPSARHHGEEHIFAAFFRHADHMALECHNRNGENDGAASATFIGQLRHYYQFVMSRAFTEAQAASLRGAPRAVLTSTSPLETLSALESIYGKLTDSSALTSQFDSDVAEGLTGVTPGLLGRHPSLRNIIRARWEALCKLVVYDNNTTPEGLKTVFRNPASGCLLRRLSAIRSLDDEWDGLALARYKRVLPFEFMAVLACRDFFRLVYQYAWACLQGLNKPMHSWELQHLLWTITMHGTDEERFRYVGTKLRDAVMHVPTGRAAPPLGPGDNRHLTNFERNLRLLGAADAYSDFDRSYDAARERIFNRTRDPSLRAHKHRGSEAGSWVQYNKHAMASKEWRKRQRVSGHSKGDVDMGGTGMSHTAASVRALQSRFW